MEINILPMEYKSDRSNFRMKFDDIGSKYEKENIEYVPIHSEKVIKYRCKLASTLLEILNKFDNIVKTLSTYKNDFLNNQELDCKGIIEILENLKKELLQESKYFHIINYYIDILIYNVTEAEENNAFIDYDIPKYCVMSIQNIIEELSQAKDQAISSFFRTYDIVDNFAKHNRIQDKDFYHTAFGTFRGTKLSLPNVEITYQDIEFGEKIETKPFYYTYYIYSIMDLVNVTLYHLRKNNRPILCCVNCNKFFVPYEHFNETDIDDNKKSSRIVNEHNDRLTCSEDCANKRREYKTKQNLYGYKKEIKNIRDNLRKKNKQLLEKFDIDRKNKEIELVKKYGEDNLETIETEMTKYILKEKEKFYSYHK